MNPSTGGIRTPDQRLRVFVSSTLKELAPKRRSARVAVERLHLAPVLFELGARPHPQRRRGVVHVLLDPGGAAQAARGRPRDSPRRTIRPEPAPASDARATADHRRRHPRDPGPAHLPDRAGRGAARRAGDAASPSCSTRVCLAVRDTGDETLMEKLTTALRQRPMLIVVDNSSRCSTPPPRSVPCSRRPRP